MNFADIQAALQPLLANDFLVGMVLAGSIAGLFYTLKSIPVKIWELFKWKTVTVLTVNSTDDIFPWLEYWLAKNTNYAKKCRRLRIAESPPTDDDDGQNLEKTSLSAGFGKHFFFHNKFPIKLEREMLADAKTGAYKINEKITISSFSKKAVLDIFSRCVDFSEETNSMGVHSNGIYNCFSKVPGVSPRPMSTIYCKDEDKKLLIERTEKFFQSREDYVSKGVPWRMGVLLYGPPGTGKSSVARALATHTEKDVYVINLGSVSSDGNLVSLMREIPPNSICLMEDIDCAGSTTTHERVINNGDSKEAVPSSLTLSGLLNAIDGVVAPEGRVLIMTTNHPEQIDPALTRPGRMDIKINLGKIGPNELQGMVRNFFKDSSKGSIDRLMESNIEIIPANAQSIMLTSNTGDEAIDKLLEVSENDK